MRQNKLERHYAPDFVFLGIIPWFHAFGSLTLICSLLVGDVVVFLPKFEEHSFLNAIEVNNTITINACKPHLIRGHFRKIR